MPPAMREPSDPTPVTRGTASRRASARTCSAARRLAPCRAQPLPHPAQRRTRTVREVRIGEEAHDLVGNRGRCQRVLQQLRHDLLVGDEVHHARVADVGEGPHHVIRQRRQAVDDDHGTSMDGRLHGRRPGSGHHCVRRREHVVRAPLDDGGSAVRREGPQRRQELVVEVRRARHHELHAGHPIADHRRPGRHVGQDRAQLVRPTPRQQRDRRRPRIQTERAEQGLARRGGRRQLEQGVADETHRDPRIAIDRRLEREDDQSQVDEPSHRPEAPAPPRPHLGADVVDHGHPEAPHGRGHAEVDLGEIDGDEHVGPIRAGARHQPAVGGVRSRHDRQRLRESGHRQSPVVGDELAPALPEPLAAEPEDPRFRIDRANLTRQRAGVEIAGRLPARDQHLGHAKRSGGAVGRRMAG